MWVWGGVGCVGGCGGVCVCEKRVVSISGAFFHFRL